MGRHFGYKILVGSIALGVSLHADAAPVPRTEGLRVQCENTQYIARVAVTNKVCFQDEESCSYAAAYMHGMRFRPNDGFGGDWGTAVPSATQVQCRPCTFPFNGESTPCALNLIVTAERGGVREFSNQDVSWQLAGDPYCVPVKKYRNHCQGDHVPRDYTEYCVDVKGELGSGGAYCKSNPLCDLKSNNPLPERTSNRTILNEEDADFAVCATDEVSNTTTFSSSSGDVEVFVTDQQVDGKERLFSK